MMERGSAKELYKGSPMKGDKSSLMTMSVKASNAHKASVIKGILKSKSNLGIDYEGVEIGGDSLADSPNKNQDNLKSLESIN